MVKRLLDYDAILKQMYSGKQLCDYVRNPTTDLIGKCGLDGLTCRDIFKEHTICPVYKNFYNSTKSQQEVTNG